MHIVVHPKIKNIDAGAWNTMNRDDNPFMRHEFLHGLEYCRCASADSGWQPLHLAVYSHTDQRELIGAMPCYLKTNSYGEYIFDWSWADAHHRNGLDYYPKLTNAIPFTPAAGQRWLVSENSQHNPDEISEVLIGAALKLVDEHNCSSMHSLFLDKQQYDFLGKQHFLQRLTNQFHWKNRNYDSFEDFLAQMSSKKRKNIKRERRRIEESNIQYEWLNGSELSLADGQTMYQFYRRTINYYGAQSYLNEAFFNYLTEKFSQQTLILFARFEDQIIAGGLYFKSSDCLYGRYWGALNSFHSVHFETCYYQAIEWCIEHGYKRFEAGAQGEHKLARGLEPTKTYSAHWIADPQFRYAIDEFLSHEKDQNRKYSKAMQSHSPFKSLRQDLE